MEQFGLLGLLHVIRMTDADLNTLALGLDLTTLGLNLNSPEYVGCLARRSAAGCLGRQRSGLMALYQTCEELTL